VQLSLFPVDEEERVLLSQGRLYQALPDVAQQLVRAYLRTRAKGACRRQADWIRETGLPASTAHDALKRHEAAIWPAIMEACQLVCLRGAQDGVLAVTVAGRIILEDLVTRRRSPSQLTPTERGLLQDNMAMLGLRLPGSSASGVAVTLPDGTRVEASTAQASSEEEALSMFALLRAKVDRICGAGSEAGAADSVRGQAGAEPAAPGGLGLEAGRAIEEMRDLDLAAEAAEIGADPALGVGQKPAVTETEAAAEPGTAVVLEKGVPDGFGSSRVAVLAVLAAAAVLGFGVSAAGGGLAAGGFRSGGEGREEYGGGGWGGLGRRENAAGLYVSSGRVRCEKITKKKFAGPVLAVARVSAAPLSGILRESCSTCPAMAGFGISISRVGWESGRAVAAAAAASGVLAGSSLPVCSPDPGISLSIPAGPLPMGTLSLGWSFNHKPAKPLPIGTLKSAGFSLCAESERPVPIHTNGQRPDVVNETRTPRFYRNVRKTGNRCQLHVGGLLSAQGRDRRQGGASSLAVARCQTHRAAVSAWARERNGRNGRGVDG
jgi:hypothetical protein